MTVLFGAVCAPCPADAQPRTLCFFSLNSAEEYQFTRAFLERTDRAGSHPVRAAEFHDPVRDANPESSFRGMVESGQVCNGLVISGHHTGSFSGHRADGVLNISFLEQLSCDPAHEDFFRRVNAVWLQGCRTLGIGPLESGLDGDYEVQADYHMQRVGAQLIQDGLEQSFADLSFEFSTTLDQDNPLASRYLRVFPAANLFGWTRSSPGENAGSDRSLLYHMAHMSHLSQGVPLFDPMRTGSSALRENMAESLWHVLGGDVGYSPLARDAWLSHGRVKQPGLGYDNPDLNTYAPLLYSSQERLLAAKTVGCEVRNAPDSGSLQTVLARLLSSTEFVAYNFNVVWEVFRHYRQQDPATYDALRSQLVTSEPLMRLLFSKLKSPRTGLLMKIEYYSFYRELSGNSIPQVEASILEHVRYFLLADDLAGSEYDIRDFRESLLVSVAGHQLADAGFYRSLIRGPDVQAATLYTLVWSFVKQSPPAAGSLIDDIVKQPQAGRGTLWGAALWLLKNGASGDLDTLETIVSHPAVDEATLATVANILAEYDLPGSESLVERIVTHPRTGGSGIRQVSLAIRKHDIPVDSTLIDAILSHPDLDKWGLQNVARVIGGHPELGSTATWDKIIHHSQVDADGLTSAAIALGQQNLDREAELLDAIRHHPRADERTMRYVDRALASHDAAGEGVQIF